MEVAAYVEFMLAVLAIALSVLVAGVTVLGVCEATEWVLTRKRATAPATGSAASYNRRSA